MTTYEHAMLGVCQALCLGLHRRHGWRPAALAGVLAVVPDWDGLTLVCGLEVFDRAHRAWGHSFLVLRGCRPRAVDGRLPFRSCRPWAALAGSIHGRTAAPLRGVGERSVLGYAIWLAIGLLASLSHLLEDLVVSGGTQLTDWELKLLWPFSHPGFVFSLVPWGDPGSA